MSVVDAGESRIELSFHPEPSVKWYELWAASDKTGKYGDWCAKDKHRCILNNLRPGINYTATLAHCYGTHPNHCLVQAKQLAVSTKPKCTLFNP